MFPGVVGSPVCKVFDYCAARTGLTESAARVLGYDVVTAYAPGPDRAHYLASAKPLLMKLVADKATSRPLGARPSGRGKVQNALTWLRRRSPRQ